MSDDRPICNAVLFSIVTRALDGDRVNIGEITKLGTQFCGSNAQNPAPASDVDDGIPIPDGLLQSLQAHGSRLVLARAERHVGIERDDDFSGFEGVADPGGHDDDTRADMDGTEMLLPDIDPVVAVDDALRHLQRAEVQPAAGAHLLQLLADGADILLRFFGREEALDEHVGGKILQIVVEIVPVDTRLAADEGNDVPCIADGDAALGIIPERVGDQFARFGRGMYGEFNVFHTVYYTVCAGTCQGKRSKPSRFSKPKTCSSRSAKKPAQGRFLFHSQCYLRRFLIFA